MDQVKEIIAKVKPHAFWILCGVILVVSLGSWYVATGSVKEQHARQLSDINGVFDQVSRIQAANQKHPNPSTAAEMEKVIRAYAKEVEDGWRKQYEQQAKVLVWPEFFGADFRAIADRMRPIEIIKPRESIANELPVDYRVQYRNYIEGDLPKLAKKIGAEWKASSTGIDPGASPVIGLDGMARPAEDKSIVLWSPENQQLLLTTHFGFASRTEPPSTLEVLYAQEDLWVLHDLMEIIAATNGPDVTARHEAAIKQIDFVKIGMTAAGLTGAVTRIGNSNVNAVNPEGQLVAPAQGEGGMNPAMQPQPQPGGEGMVAGAAATGDPATGRYVDEKYQPLDPTRLRNALTSTSPEDALLAVAKRMPVRLRFRLDQRKLHVLLTECGNARLPVEVRQVRINPDAAVSGTASAGGGGGGPVMSPFGPSGGGEGGYGPARPSSIVADATVDPTLIDVELYGIVYIYNPVNKAQLNVVVPAGTTAAVMPTAPLGGG
ncbi:MAG: hypothetical protein SFU86_07620 [Pirellulaceae bacterium]|nr:hypothetical protein [Pirellulaceae bacterium]